eukprot:scaffold3908_cov133-Isochrysis_galbana.AAC.2
MATGREAEPHGSPPWQCQAAPFRRVLGAATRRRPVTLGLGVSHKRATGDSRTAIQNPEDCASLQPCWMERKRYSLAATWLGSSALLPSGHSPSPPPFFPHPVFLIQAAISGGWRQSCVHYNSLG